MKNEAELQLENERILKEYRRREKAVPDDLYAPWNAAQNLAVFERRLAAAALLHREGKFPAPGTRALEIGYGRIGWLADLIAWGLREADLSGIELDAPRAAVAQAALPQADLRVGDASALPWPDDSFELVVVSTVFSSILQEALRRSIAAEIERVLAPGGVLLWYDLAVDNPRNRNVRGIGKGALAELFPRFVRHARKVTLAPPIARAVAPKSLAVAAALQALPFLRSHLLAVLIKS